MRTDNVIKMKLVVFKRDGSTASVWLLPNKEDGTFSFVNMSKGHICPCKFKTVQEALDDILTYPQNEYYRPIEVWRK